MNNKKINTTDKDEARETIKMRKKELSRLHYLNKDIERERKQLQELELIGCSITSKITGLPHMAGVSDKVGDIASEIADLKIILEAHLRQSVREYTRLCKYISGITDPIMRSIIYYRHVKSMSWVEIAMQIGGGNTPDGVRKAHDRYLSRENRSKN